MNDLILNDNIDLSGYMDGQKVAMLVKPAKTWHEDLKDSLVHAEENAGAFLPWTRHRDKLRFRLGETTVWSGDSGAGKSFINNQLAMCFADQSILSLMASFEMQPIKTLQRMVCQNSLTSKFRNTKEDDIDKLIRKIQGKIWLYSQTGQINFNKLIAIICYCAEQLSIQHFFIDSLMMITATDDERQLFNLQRNVVQKLVKLGSDLNIHIHIVTHFSKSGTKEQAGKNSVSGHKDITNLAHNVILLQNNINNDGTRISGDADLWLTIDKQRDDGFKGSFPLYRTNDILMFRDHFHEHAPVEHAY